jgi:hypothetical protein
MKEVEEIIWIIANGHVEKLMWECDVTFARSLNEIIGLA